MASDRNVDRDIKGLVIHGRAKNRKNLRNGVHTHIGLSLEILERVLVIIVNRKDILYGTVRILGRKERRNGKASVSAMVSLDADSSKSDASVFSASMPFLESSDF